MSEYKITAIDVHNINEWASPQGNTIYYIPVTLEGHDKIVSVGKLSPDALKVGDSIEGDIIPTDKSEDKWKAAPFKGKPGGKPIRRSFGAIQADKNQGQRIGMVVNNAANYVQTLTLMEKKVLKPSEWAETVAKYAKALLPLSDLKDTSDGAESEVGEQIKTVFGVE